VIGDLQPETAHLDMLDGQGTANFLYQPRKQRQRIVFWFAIT
jgi:hypothetical protein